MSRPGIEPMNSRSPERTLYQLSYRGRSRDSDFVNFEILGTGACGVVIGGNVHRMDICLAHTVAEWSTLLKQNIWMKCLHAFGINRHKCKADVSCLFQYRSLWPIFYGPVILSYILKTIWCMCIILWEYESVRPDYLMHEHYYLGYESVWPNVLPQNKYRSLWPIFYGPVIVHYILKTIWCMNIILWD